MKKLTTYNDFKKEIEKLSKELAVQEDNCAKKGLSFDEMIEQTRELRIKIYELSQEMRLVQAPTLEFGKEWKGDYYTIEEFIENCKDDTFTDDEGYGYYATETGKSDIKIYPSDVIDNKIRTDFSHVIWFPKE